MNKFESNSEPALDRVEVVSERPLRPEIETLIMPIRTLLNKIHLHIDAGDYRLLIGSDVSGRIPALIFTQVIREVYKKRGFDIPRTLTTFIAGGERQTSIGGPKAKRKEIHDHLLKNYTKENLEPADVSSIDRVKLLVGSDDFTSEYHGRVLIIEDTISSGESIKPITDVLKSMGVDFDIVSIGALFFSKEKAVEKMLGSEIYYAMTQTPPIYNKRSLAGVRKERGDLFSKPRGDLFSKPEVMIMAREDVNQIAKELTKWYLSKF